MPDPPTFRRRLYDLLEANNRAGMLLEAVTVLLIVVNVVCFMLSTERSLKDSSVAWMIFDTVEVCTVSGILSADFLVFFDGSRRGKRPGVNSPPSPSRLHR